LIHRMHFEGHVETILEFRPSQEGTATTGFHDKHLT
jgi:hypothetical protein